MPTQWPKLAGHAKPPPTAVIPETTGDDGRRDGEQAGAAGIDVVLAES